MSKGPPVLGQENYGCGRGERILQFVIFFTKSDKFSEVFMNVFSEIALGDLQGHLMLPSQEEG